MNSAEKGLIPLTEIVDSEAFDALPKIGFAGPPSSGKGTAADFLSKRYNLAQATFSQGIRNHLKFVHGIEEPYPRDLLKNTGLGLIDAFGPLALVKMAMKRTMLEFSHNPTLQGIVIDGFRWPQEGEAISQMPNSYIIWVEAPQEIRKERLFARSRPGDMTQTDFYTTDKMETDWVEPIRKFASETVTNEGDVESFHQKLAQIVEVKLGLNPQFNSQA